MKNATSEMNEMIKVLHLEEKINAEATTLSGGEKRKLSVGISLISGSKVHIYKKHCYNGTKNCFQLIAKYFIRPILELVGLNADLNQHIWSRHVCWQYYSDCVRVAIIKIHTTNRLTFLRFSFTFCFYSTRKRHLTRVFVQ